MARHDLVRHHGGLHEVLWLCVGMGLLLAVIGLFDWFMIATLTEQAT